MAVTGGREGNVWGLKENDAAVHYILMVGLKEEEKSKRRGKRMCVRACEEERGKGNDSH
jgi:hypothetical protein